MLKSKKCIKYERKHENTPTQAISMLVCSYIKGYTVI